MASTQKTELLGLSKWTETDRPKRSDFVADNTLIDNVLGTHINDSKMHLSEREREKLDKLNHVYQFAGNGAASRSITLPFEPSFIIVFKKGDAPAVYNSAGHNVINLSYASSGGASGGGITLSGSTLTVRQSESASNGVFYNLNAQFAQYIVFMLY